MRHDDPHTWRTRTGEQIPIKDLDDDHLLNIVRLIERADVRELRRLLGFAADLREATSTLWRSRVLAPETAATTPWTTVRAERIATTQIQPPPDVVVAREVLAGTDRDVLLHLVPQIPALEGEVLRRGLRP